jgi:hypothetical protein
LPAPARGDGDLVNYQCLAGPPGAAGAGATDLAIAGGGLAAASSLVWQS